MGDERASGRAPRRQFLRLAGGGAASAIAIGYGPAHAAPISINGHFRAEVDDIAALLIPQKHAGVLRIVRHGDARLRRWEIVQRKVSADGIKSAERGLALVSPVRSRSTEAFMRSTGKLLIGLGVGERNDLSALLSISFSVGSELFLPNSSHPTGIWLQTAADLARSETRRPRRRKWETP